MIKVFLVIVACQAPNFTQCNRLSAIQMPDPVVCNLNRPAAALLYQLSLPDGWLIFTRCALVNSEKNERRG